MLCIFAFLMLANSCKHGLRRRCKSLLCNEEFGNVVAYGILCRWISFSKTKKHSFECYFCGGEEEIRPTAERVSVLTKRSVQRRVRQRCCPRHFMPLNLFLQNKKALIWVLFLWRRRRDSNSWTAFDGYAISSRAPSTKLGDFSIRYIFNFKWVAVGSQWKTKPFPPTVHGYSTLKTQRDDYISPKRFWQAVEQFYFIFFDLYVFNWVLNKTENVSDFWIVLKT